MTYSLDPIGFVRSPFKEKFAVPRQPRLTPSACSHVELINDANNVDAFRGIETFSHLWLLFLFDRNLCKGWSPTVRPPRLGGNKRIGVFSSRASFRPNGIGMSAVEFKRLECIDGQVTLHLGSCDLVDGTPIIDIKPYIPYSDSISHAVAGFAQEPPMQRSVNLSQTAICDIKRLNIDPRQIRIMHEVLAQDPRPAYKNKGPDLKDYAVHLFDFNLKFQVIDNQVLITKIEAFGDHDPDC